MWDPLHKIVIMDPDALHDTKGALIGATPDWQHCYDLEETRELRELLGSGVFVKEIFQQA